MNRYARFIVLAFFAWNVITPLVEAAKFGDASMDDIVQQEKQRKFSQPQLKTPSTTPIPVPTITASPSNPWQAPKTPACVDLTSTVIAPATITTSDISAPAGPTVMPQMKSLIDIKKTDITVPSYESRYQAMIKAKLKAKAERKKQIKLIDRIIDEVANYGIWFMLGLVAFVMIYTIYKEKETDKKIAAEQEQLKQQQQSQKKDIWTEGF